MPMTYLLGSVVFKRRSWSRPSLNPQHGRAASRPRGHRLHGLAPEVKASIDGNVI